MPVNAAAARGDCSAAYFSLGTARSSTTFGGNSRTGTHTPNTASEHQWRRIIVTRRQQGPVAQCHVPARAQAAAVLTPAQAVPSTVVFSAGDVYTTLSCVVRARDGTRADADDPTIPVLSAEAANVVSGVSAQTAVTIMAATTKAAANHQNENTPRPGLWVGTAFNSARRPARYHKDTAHTRRYSPAHCVSECCHGGVALGHTRAVAGGTSARAAAPQQDRHQGQTLRYPS